MLRQRTGRPEQPPHQVLVRLRFRGAYFRLAPDRIVEVTPVEGYTRLRCQDPANLGVVLHRDRVIPLVDPGPRLGIGSATPTFPTLCVIVLTDRGEVAVPVDEVLGFAPLDHGAASRDVILKLDRAGESHGQSAAR